MWAEWMKDYDLSVTKKDIEKYEKMKRERGRKKQMSETKSGFHNRVRTDELGRSEFIDYIKYRVASYVGNQIIEFCKDLDFEKFRGQENVDIEINIDNCKFIDDYRFTDLFAQVRLRTPIRIERTLVTRKEEVTVDSKWYCGSKLTWKERWEALFKGRLYGGSEKIRQIRE